MKTANVPKCVPKAVPIALDNLLIGLHIKVDPISELSCILIRLLDVILVMYCEVVCLIRLVTERIQHIIVHCQHVLFHVEPFQARY